MMSSAIKPLPKLFAASEWIQTPAHAASKGFIFLFPTKLDIIPDNTSPEPIVASSGVEFVFIQTLPFGDAIIVLNFYVKLKKN